MNLKVGFYPKEFEKLKLKKMIECSFCGTKSIDKTIMSPNIGIKELEEKVLKPQIN